MRVLMICPELPDVSTPGSMAPCARQIDSLISRGIEADVIDMRGIPKLKYLQVLPRIRAAMRGADLVHAHFGYCGWLAYLARKTIKCNAPIVMSYMGDDLLGTPKNERGELEWFSKKMVAGNQFLAPKLDHIIVKSQEMANVLAGVATSVIPNGVDTAAFQPKSLELACKELGWAVGPNRVLFPGNPDNPRKGFAFATAAIREAEARLGQGIEVVPLWGVAPEQVATYMNACQAMVMTSFIEGSPNVVKEAMACDRPVVGVDVGDVAQLLAEVPGCWVSNRDETQFASSLCEAINEGASQGRQAILDRKLDLESVACRIEDIYRTVLSMPAVDMEVHQNPQGGKAAPEFAEAVKTLTGSEG